MDESTLRPGDAPSDVPELLHPGKGSDFDAFYSNNQDWCVTAAGCLSLAVEESLQAFTATLDSLSEVG